MANTSITGLPVRIGLDGSEWIPLQVVGETAERARSSLFAQLAVASQLPAAIEFTIDGAGGTISAQTWGYLTVPFNATITGWTLVGDQTGSIIVNVWKCTYAQFDPPTTPSAANDITNGNPPTIATAKKNQDTDLVDWTTTTLTEGDILAFNVPSTATSISRVTLSLALTRIVS